MKLYFFGILFIFLPYISFGAIDINEFYRIFASGNLQEINTCILSLKSNEPSSLLNAYTGALLMRRASLEKEPKVKLESFKNGCKLLENEISKNPGNVEYRFLRLVIQEKAPEILKYKRNLQEDKKIITSGFHALETYLRKQIKQYSERSKIITTNELL